MSGPPRAPRLGYSPALDGLRGLSVLAVVGYHAFGFPSGGFLGVQVFFVLSGFLITVLLVQERERSGRISLRAFYRRRAFRLLPALVTVVAAYLAISAVRLVLGDLHEDGLADALRGALFGVTYVSNAVIAWHGNLASGIQHLWSLAAEEQFYLVWPLLLVLCLRARRSHALLLGLAGTGVLLVDLHRLQLTLAGAPERRLYSAPDTTADAVLVGCVLGLVYCTGALERAVATRLWRRGAVPVALVTLLAVVLLVPNTDYRPLYEALLPLAVLGAAVLVGAAACDPPGRVARFLSRSPLVSLGAISYGVYLWHPVLLYGTGLWLPLPSVVAALLAARISYVVVERPFLERRRARTAAHDRPDARQPAPVPSVATT